MLIKRKNNPPNPLNPCFIVPIISIKTTGIPMDIGKIAKQELNMIPLFRKGFHRYPECNIAGGRLSGDGGELAPSLLPI